ncbi:MAG: LysR family transcriptional regulator [Novosphingobium sp.]
MSPNGMWEHQRTFLAVFEQGSFSAAARSLGVTQPTVRCRIEALENALATRLFTRSTNGLVPTGQAQGLAPHARAMEFASNAFIRAASTPPNDVGGSVRISVSEIFGVEVLSPMLVKLRARYPALAIEIVPSNQSADLLGQEADIAIRNFQPTQDALVARLLGTIALGFFAAADYLAQRPAPRTVVDLLEHDLIGPDRSRADIDLAASLHPALTLSTIAIRTDSHPAQLAAIRAGLGVGITLATVGHADPRLRRILPDVELPALPYWIIMHKDLCNLARIRAVVDHLTHEITQYIEGKGSPPPEAVAG